MALIKYHTVKLGYTGTVILIAYPPPLYVVYAYPFVPTVLLP